MANDRIWLRCKECGAQRLLYKFYPGEGYVYHSDVVLGAWMNEHLHERLYGGDLQGNPGFTLATESDPVVAV